MTSLLDYTPIFSLYLIWVCSAQNEVISFPRAKFLALCLANNTRNRSELPENLHTKTSVVNRGLAYVFHLSINKHAFRALKITLCHKGTFDPKYKKQIQKKVKKNPTYLFQERIF